MACYFRLHLMGGLLPPSGDLNFECFWFHLLSGSRPQSQLPRGPLGSQHVSLVDFLHVYFQGLFGLSGVIGGSQTLLSISVPGWWAEKSWARLLDQHHSWA